MFLQLFLIWQLLKHVRARRNRTFIVNVVVLIESGITVIKILQKLLLERQKLLKVFFPFEI